MCKIPEPTKSISKTEACSNQLTNSIEIFIDANGQVTFSDLPEDLLEVVQSLGDFEADTQSWCALYPETPEK